jgi:pimeloyl-ACP methyl ester carboxylesterase
VTSKELQTYHRNTSGHCFLFNIRQLPNNPSRRCNQRYKMRHLSIIFSLSATLVAIATSTPVAHQAPLTAPSVWDDKSSSNISLTLFAELEELSRVVDISYCVGTTGISKPFSCASRCNEFPSFELVDTFNTGHLMSDSCGYIVLDHRKRWAGRGKEGRVIVAVRGTYSIANTIVDLSTVPQEYVPYPGNPDEDQGRDPTKPPSRPEQSRRKKHRFWDWIPKRPGWLKTQEKEEKKCRLGEVWGDCKVTCNNCTVHTGFWTSWQNTRTLVLPHLEYLRAKYPSYSLHLVGHSLGGAVAALAALEFEGLGWEPTVTTFGEPRVGNAGLRNWIDWQFSLPSEHMDYDGHSRPLKAGRYRRVTHIDDPVPLLPLEEWGYRTHAGEVYISKPSLQPTVSDLRLCFGDEDPSCLSSAEVDESWFNAVINTNDPSNSIIEEDMAWETRKEHKEGETAMQKRWGVPIPARYKMWQLFFAHRDYFWRLGLCVPGGDPLDWGRDRYDFDDDDGEEEGRKEL